MFKYILLSVYSFINNHDKILLGFLFFFFFLLNSVVLFLFIFNQQERF